MPEWRTCNPSAILSEVRDRRWLRRRATQQTLRGALRQHRRVDRQHAAGRAAAPLAEARGPDLRQARGPQPDRLGQGPGRQVDDRGGRGRGADRAGPDDPRADLRQHRHLAGDDLPPQGLPAEGRDARQRHRGAHPAAARCTGRRSSTRRAPRAPTARSRWRWRWPRTRATTCPTSTATRPTRSPTTTAPRSRSSKSSTRSPPSSAASAPAAP